MRNYWPLLPVAAILLAGAAVAVPARAAASQHPYRLVDPGTFGGPQSFLNLPAVPLTPGGVLLGTADTATHDADYPKCNPFMVGFPDRYLVHAFAWHNGRLRDLGALPGNNSSAVFEVNGSGVGAGMSETAITDPVPLQNAAGYSDLRVHGSVHAARWYSLIMPPSTFRRCTGASNGTTAGSS